MQSKDAIECTQTADAVTFFDNDQVMISNLVAISETINNFALTIKVKLKVCSLINIFFQSFFCLENNSLKTN